MRMTGPLPVSLVVITRDAATDIAECLLSAPFCADALVVDSGSGDHTVETARRCGARVVTHAWAGFGPQKQSIGTVSLAYTVLGPQRLGAVKHQ